jgi:hypothetical protein
MRKKKIPVPVLGAIAATRGMLGAGAALLLAPRLPEKKRKIVGMALMGVGIATTIPLASYIFSK